jgi:hypothetical protein
MAQATKGKGVCPHTEEQKLFCKPDKTRHLTELDGSPVSAVACSFESDAW